MAGYSAERDCTETVTTHCNFLARPAVCSLLRAARGATAAIGGILSRGKRNSGWLSAVSRAKVTIFESCLVHFSAPQQSSHCIEEAEGRRADGVGIRQL